MTRVVVVADGRRRRAATLEADLAGRLTGAYEVDVLETGGPGDAVDLAARASEDGADYLIAAGGDGLLNEVVNGYLEGAEPRRQSVTLGTLPLGTGNDFARTIGLTGGVEQLVGLVEDDRAAPLDLGQLHYTDLDGRRTSRYFVNIADVGIGAAVVERVNASRNLLGSTLGYTAAILRSLLRYEPRRVRIEADTFDWEGPVLAACLANARYFGSGLCIAPRAEVDDGRLEVVILGEVGVLEYLRYLPRVRRGEVLEHPEVHYHEATRCTITGLDGPCGIDMDGDFVGHTPLEVETVAGAVRFLR